MKKTWFTNSARLVAGCSMIALTAGAHAQSSDNDFVLEEIVVTAQKREQSLQDVPISVSALGGEKLKDFAAGGEDIRLLSSRIPGLNAESSNGRVAPRFYIRGLGNTDFDLAASQPVSIVVDDVVLENVILKSFPLFDIDRVEVLRGPQGTLFGRNTPAGIVKFDTRKPTQEAEGYVNASYGTYGTASLEAAYGAGISDKVAVRVSGLLSRRNDWIDNGFSGKEDEMGGYVEAAMRAQVLIEPTDTFSALLNYHYRSLDGTSEIFRANIFDAGSNELNGNFDRDTVYHDDTHRNEQSYNSWGTSAKLEWDVSESMTLTSVSAYETTSGCGIGDIDGGNTGGPGVVPFPSTTEDCIDNLDQFTQELRVSGQGTDKLFYQFGFFYFDSDFTIRTRPFFVPDSTVRHQNQTWALFGQLSYDLTENTTLTVGGRYTDDEKTADAYSGAFGSALPTVELNGDNFSWDVALNHIINDDLSVYARVATGFRAPTIQGRDVAFFGVPTTAKEETITSYEAGFKSDLVDGRMRWNGAIFYYEMDDLQVTAVGGGTNNVRLLNLNEVKGYGFETDLEFLVTENLSLTAGASYAHTKIYDGSVRVPICGTGMCTPTDRLDNQGRAIINGNPLPQAPDWTFNLVADYVRPTGDGEEFFMSADWAYQGDTNLLLYTTEEFYTDGTFELGLRVGYRWADNQYELAFFGRNITDEKNVKGVIDFNNLTGFVNEPRVFGLAFRADF
ncbi:TonB-dependent receptor [Kordiimonas gwangyangensis]|uniref:TonB-dependent receptor n=1 Tax=Kordiimonas gwangyangensis TaxID=288022 RepID=UPI00035E20BC|nr:TonB-dependent receptor [Kordiimonas gwangyangensis]